MSDKLSRKILDQALAQQDELEAEYGTNFMGSKTKKSLSDVRTSLGQKTDKDVSSEEEDFSDEHEDYYEDLVSCLFSPGK